jgi:hypothetical protein
MTRLRHDLDFLTSVALLATGVATGLTGVIADLWDLNDFWYHTVSGYLMGGFAIAHVWFNRERLVGYARHRWRTWRQPQPAVAFARPTRSPSSLPLDPEPTNPWSAMGRAVLSRRGLFGLTLGSVAGIALGRGLRPAPPIEAGADVGVIYHQWSKPGILDALGSVANWGQPVALYKVYPGASVIALPEPALEGSLPTAKAIAARRSTRDYVQSPMSSEELSRLLFLTGGAPHHRPAPYTRSSCTQSYTASTRSIRASTTTPTASTRSSRSGPVTSGQRWSTRRSPRSSSASAASSCS